MKRWLQSDPGIATAALLAGIAVLSTIRVENKQIQWADWTGLGQDQEITLTEKFTSPNCDLAHKDPTDEDKKRVTKASECSRATKTVSGKTLWDVLSLLGVPVALALLAFWLQQLQQKQASEAAKRERTRAEEQAKLQQKQAEETAERERERAEEAAKEEVLQAYFDRISALLIDKNVIAIAVEQEEIASRKLATDPPIPIPQRSTPNKPNEQKELVDVARDVIRARTLSIMRRLKNDGERKGNVIRFLLEIGILSKLKLDLSDADLSDISLADSPLCGDFYRANFKGAILRKTSFCYAHIDNGRFYRRDAKLNEADFSGADLSGADLRKTSLSNAILSDTNLSNAKLDEADLSNAKLNGADLSGAGLRDAILTYADLSNTEIKRTNFRDANLGAANLSNTEISKTIFRDAILSYTKFNGALILGTDLSTAQGLTQEQLEGEEPPYLCKVKLPPGITINPNRDCNQIPQILQQRYPDSFKTIEEAQKYIDSL